MRTMLRVTVDTPKGNTAIKDGSLPKIIQDTMAALKPEAAYFFPDNGKRTAFFFFDLQDVSQIPKIGEPFFMHLNAEVEIKPVMNAEELAKGLSGM